MASTLSVRVVVRMRPANDRELREMQASRDNFAYAIENDESIALSGRLLSAGQFSSKFDHVFDTVATQDDLFACVAAPTIGDVLKGYNGTILAYGQTGASRLNRVNRAL